MSRISQHVAVLWALGGTTGCLPPEPGLPSLSGEGSGTVVTSTSSGTTDAGTTTALASSSGTTPAGTTTGALDSSTGAPGSSSITSGDAGSTTDGPGVMTGPVPTDCEPDPMDDECIMCLKDMCCMELEACYADGDATTGCVCFQECVQAGGSPIGECDSMCMVSPLDGGTPTGQLGSCTVSNCMICLAG